MKYVVVTDPCYILSDKTWDELGNKYGWGDEFTLKVAEKLREISGDPKAVAGITKVGDWCNSMTYIGGICHVLEPDFAADSGMVCAVELTDKLQEYWQKNGSSVSEGCVARLKVPKVAFYELNFIGEQTKVNIWFDEFKTLLASSEE